jgi:hypothetical protein
MMFAPVRGVLVEPVDLVEVGDDDVDEDAAAGQEEQARRDEVDVRPIGQDVGGPRLTRDPRPRAALARSRGLPLADSPDDTGHRDELDDRDGHEGQRQVAGDRRDRAEEEPGDVAQDLHQPDQPAGHADLVVRHEVGHVALEWTASRIRRERQQDDQRGHRDQRVRVGDPEQEDDVEQRADDDERLAPAPPRRREVADVADRRLDDDRDDGAADRHEEQRPPDLERVDEAAELDPVLDEQADRGVDRGQTQPVGR